MDKAKIIEDCQKFIERAWNDKTFGGEFYVTDIVESWNKQKVNEILKKEVTDYFFNANDIRHIKKHSKDSVSTNGQFPLTLEDALRLPYVLSAPDDVLPGNRNSKNGMGVKFIKKFEDGRVFCVLIDKKEDGKISPKTGFKKPLRGIDAKTTPILNVRNAQATSVDAKVTDFFVIASDTQNKSSFGNAADEPIISREEMLEKTADEIAEIANRNTSGYSEYSNWRTNKRTALAIYDDYKKGKLSFENGYFVPSVPIEPKFKVGDRVKSLTYKDAFGNDIATITKVHLLKFGTVVRYDLHFDDYGNVRGFYEQDLMLLENEPQPTAQPDDEEEMLEIEAEALQLAIKLKLALLDKAEPQADSQYPQRNGNVTANDLKATFGFRYVNVDINLDEKQEQQMLNVSYDTFRLLAQVIGKPMIAIGLGRNLTLNIGIKRMDFTTGGCYSLQYKALNFKSLDDYKHIAHEWLHALDHYLYYTYGTVIPEKPYIMQSTRMLWRPIARNEIRNAFYEVNALIMRSDYQKRSEEVAAAAHDKYWIDNSEKMARAFEVWTDAKMRAIGEHNNHLVSMFPNNPYPDFSNPKDAPISAAFDALFAAFRMEKYPYDIESLR